MTCKSCFQLTARRSGIFLLALLFLGFITNRPAAATDPPSAKEVEQMIQAGVYEERVERAKQLGFFQPSPALWQNGVRKIHIEALKASGEAASSTFGGPLGAYPYSKPPELASRERVKTLTLLVDFKDHHAVNDPNLAGLDADTVRESIYGLGEAEPPSHFPYESMRSYYRRASQYSENEQGEFLSGVDVNGEVIGWCHLKKNRSKYEPTRSGNFASNLALFELVEEAMIGLDPSVGFSEFDNDGDGDIDLVTIIYAGEPAGWMSFWWAYRWEFFVPEASEFQFDGKRLRQFVFQFASKRDDDTFDPTTLIHEMGHAFGLPDYYDYKPGMPNRFVDGGIGGLDMMHANIGNHNAFSRWLLDWVDPEEIGLGEPIPKTLRAAGLTNRDAAVAIFPGLRDSNAPDREMFIVENRHQVGNDHKMPGSGLLVWHVDATPRPDNQGFLMNNSDTNHKLLRLVRADSPRDFADREWGSAGSYFNRGEALTPDSNPNSDGCRGPTGISVAGISANGEAVMAEIGFVPGVVPVFSPPVASPPAATGPGADSLPVRLASKQNQPIDPAEVELFLSEFRDSSPEELTRLWNTVYDEKRWGLSSDQYAYLLQVLLIQLAAKDGQVAIDILQKLPDSEAQTFAFAPIMEAWGYNDPGGAAQWYLAPEQQVIRKKMTDTQSMQASLAMERFTKEIYRCSAMENPVEAIAAIDELHQVGEIKGALEGVCEAGQLLGRDEQSLHESVMGLDKNGETAEALLMLLNAKNVIQNPDKRLEFQQFIER